MVDQSHTDTMMHSTSNRRLPLTPEDARVYNVGQRLSTATVMINDVRPHKLPGVTFQEEEDAPSKDSVDYRLPKPWKKAFLGRATNSIVGREQQQQQQEQQRGRGDPFVGDPLLDAFLADSGGSPQHRAAVSSKLTAAPHFDRKLPPRDAEWPHVERHYPTRTTEHYCPVNPGGVGDPLPAPKNLAPRRPQSAPPGSSTTTMAVRKLPLTPADAQVLLPPHSSRERRLPETAQSPVVTGHGDPVVGDPRWHLMYKPHPW